MAKKTTSRKPLTANNRSHALNKTKRQQKLNIQKKTVDGKKVRVSVRETKNNKK